MEENGRNERYQIGLYIMMILAVLTVGEFMIGIVGAPWWAVFILISLLKAWFVIMNYMHLPRLFAEEETHS